MLLNKYLRQGSGELYLHGEYIGHFRFFSKEGRLSFLWPSYFGFEPILIVSMFTKRSLVVVSVTLRSKCDTNRESVQSYKIILIIMI